MRLTYLHTIWLTVLVVGCGTTKWSDTSRTATEQLLLSTAVDRAIDNMDFTPLMDKYVYLDSQYLDCVDKGYVLSTLRQHMLSEGCVLTATADAADYVVEVRSGAVGTDHHDVLVGVPAISLGTGMMGMPSAIPEIPFAKTTAQKGVVKLACFAYHRESGQAYWQSGTFPIVASAKDSWFLGTGPFQRGNIYDSTHFAGSRFLVTRKSKEAVPLRKPDVAVAANAQFPSRPALARRPANKGTANQPAQPTKTAGGAPPPASVSGTSGPSLNSGTAGPSLGGASPPAASGGNSTIANAGISTGLPAGQVVRLPTVPQSTTSNTASSSGLGSLFKFK
ncbi:MAG TPA: DUF6655 family protein [Pirellulales bacterium]|nr:DUF6655 family protein [Pirellulales bacterium]